MKRFCHEHKISTAATPFSGFSSVTQKQSLSAIKQGQNFTIIILQSPREKKSPHIFLLEPTG
jgi:hypothetical protein